MTMRLFQRKKENFTCENCGYYTVGNGYTNHCPKCLYSKHVDINPGDRLAKCGGLMRPVDFDTKDGEYIIIQRCNKCGHIKRNKLSGNDNLEKLLDIAKNKS